MASGKMSRKDTFASTGAEIPTLLFFSFDSAAILKTCLRKLFDNSFKMPFV
jgi:hypothetical protein